MRVVSYNVENLFDTLRNPLRSDTEFLPRTPRRWNSARYMSKLSRLATTLLAIGGGEPPAIIGLCEIENDSVARDLCRRTRLASAGYAHVTTESPDARGINLALLYQPQVFDAYQFDTLRILPATPHARPTRDVLHAAGRVTASGDTLDVFLVHLPSRGGRSAAERLRLHITQRIRAYADSLQRSRERFHCIIMGDFNDHARSACVVEGLRAIPLAQANRGAGCEGSTTGGALGAAASEVQNEKRLSLIALSESLRTAYDGYPIDGSYKFRGRWEQLDQMVVSAGLPLAPRGCYLFVSPLLLEPDEEGFTPFRTYRGALYHGGVSDHLPLVLDIDWPCR